MKRPSPINDTVIDPNSIQNKSSNPNGGPTIEGYSDRIHTKTQSHNSLHRESHKKQKLIDSSSADIMVKLV